MIERPVGGVNASEEMTVESFALTGSAAGCVSGEDGAKRAYFKDTADLSRGDLARVDADVLNGTVGEVLAVAALTGAKSRGVADGTGRFEGVDVDVEFLVGAIDKDFDAPGFA